MQVKVSIHNIYHFHAKMSVINRQCKRVQVFKVMGRQNSKFNRLLQKEGNITWLSTPLTQIPINQGITHTPAMLTLCSSQEGVQAVQALNPRQSVLTPGLE